MKETRQILFPSAFCLLPCFFRVVLIGLWKIQAELDYLLVLQLLALRARSAKTLLTKVLQPINKGITTKSRNHRLKV
jgi:hypothetical protein